MVRRVARGRRGRAIGRRVWVFPGFARGSYNFRMTADAINCQTPLPVAFRFGRLAAGSGLLAGANRSEMDWLGTGWLIVRIVNFSLLVLIFGGLGIFGIIMPMRCRNF